MFSFDLKNFKIHRVWRLSEQGIYNLIYKEDEALKNG